MSNDESSTQSPIHENIPNRITGSLLVLSDGLFDSMFAYLLYLYSVKIPIACRRIAETVILLFAITSLILLIKSHTCIARVSNDFLSVLPRGSLKDEIVRIEIKSEDIGDYYTLEDSYLKEFIHLGGLVDNFPYIRNIGNISSDQCPVNGNMGYYSNFSKNLKSEEMEGTIIEYSEEYSLLRLSPRLRDMFGIPVHHFVIDENELIPDDDYYSKHYFGDLIGFDILVLKALSRYSANFTGYARNVLTGLSYSYSGSRQFGFELLALSILTYSVFTISIFFLLNFAYNQISLVIVIVVQRLDFNRTISAFGGAFTVLLSFIGIELIISEFFQNAIVSCYVILLMWVKSQYQVFITHSHTARGVFFSMSAVCELLFYMHHYRYSGMLDRHALLTCWLFVSHAALYSFHHYALPDFERGLQPERTE